MSPHRGPRTDATTTSHQTRSVGPARGPPPRDGAPAGHTQLVDFGLAVRVPEGTQHFTVCGSTEYMAPEVVRQSGYDAAADWWSFGCLLYEMSCARAAHPAPRASPSPLVAPAPSVSRPVVRTR